MHIVVTIDVPDLDQGIAFYRDALGFEERVRPLPNFVIMTNGKARIGLMRKDAGTKPAPGSGDVRDYARHWTPVHADRKSTRLNSSHVRTSRMPSSA